ncbi:MAG: hypothetical protein NC242_12305 [Roseburia sp.]|nr:hypothetical protein [Roseburia sp.]
MKKSRVNRLLAAGLSFAMAVAALPLGGGDRHSGGDAGGRGAEDGRHVGEY